MVSYDASDSGPFRWMSCPRCGIVMSISLMQFKQKAACITDPETCPKCLHNPVNHTKQHSSESFDI